VKRIVAVADTHLLEGQSLRDTIPREILERLQDADLVIHAGSFTSLECYRQFKELNNLVAVWGDMDEQQLKEILPLTKTLEIEGVKIGVIHRGRHITDTTSMRYLALEMGVDVIIFGYLHKPLIDSRDVLVVCAGSPTMPRMSYPGAIELTIENGRVDGNIIACEGATCGYIRFAKQLEDAKPF